MTTLKRVTANAEIDRTTLAFVTEIWKPTSFIRDSKIVVVSISRTGFVQGYNERLDPENDAERWVAFHTNVAHRSFVCEAEMVPLLSISHDGKLFGDGLHEWEVSDRDAIRQWSGRPSR